jgi:hypothetical protein
VTKRFIERSCKGQTRQYRKVCRELCIPFPLREVYHLNTIGGFLVLPENLVEVLRAGLKVYPVEGSCDYKEGS